MDENTLKTAIEAILFVSGQPVSTKKIKDYFTDEAEGKEVETALNSLVEDWKQREGALEIVHTGGGFRFRTRPEYSQYVKKAFTPKPRSMTAAALETISIVAYRQPIVRSEIEKLRGVDCGGVLKTLMEKDVIKIVGRRDEPGQPMLYATTPQFLELFGIDSLSDLPPLKEVEDIKEDLLSREGEADEELAKFIASENHELTQKHIEEDTEALTELEGKLREVRKLEREIFPPEKKDENQKESEENNSEEEVANAEPASVGEEQITTEKTEAGEANSE